jgi:hypothetical protein
VDRRWTRRRGHRRQRRKTLQLKHYPPRGRHDRFRCSRRCNAPWRRIRASLWPSKSHVKPTDTSSLEVEMSDNPRWFAPPGYGMKRYADIFTPRQLVARTTFSDLVAVLQSRPRPCFSVRRALAYAVLAFPNGLGCPLLRGLRRCQTFANYNPIAHRFLFFRGIFQKLLSPNGG